MHSKTNSKIKDRVFLFVTIGLLTTFGVFSAVVKAIQPQSKPEEPEMSICDGIEITTNCQGEDGLIYSKYIYHEAIEEVTETIYHPAESAKTHTVHHEATYGTRQIQECIKTTISYKRGSCALSQCMDGEFSGSAGRGTCSYHGGVARSGGPWYTYRTETYIITPAWDETIIDEPAKEAWTETKVISPAKEAYYEKELAS